MTYKDGQDAEVLDILTLNKLGDEPLADDGEAAAPEPEEEEASAVDGDEPDGDDAAEDEAKPKGKPKVQKRIDELTKARREAERRAELAEAEIKRLGRPEPADDLTAPDPESYTRGDDDPRYAADLAVYKMEQREQKRRTTDAERADKSRAEQAQLDWQRRTAEAAGRYGDFRAVAFANFPVTDAMAQAMQQTEAGPDVLYYLGQNTDEAARISTLSPLRQVIEIGKIESRLDLEAPAEPIAKRTTAAPAPAKRLGGKSAPQKGLDKMSYEEYKAHRMEQEAKRR